MPEAVSTNQGTTKSVPSTPKPFAPEDEAALREALKRCSPSTFEAAVQYRKTGNPEHVPAVVIGVIERFVIGIFEFHPQIRLDESLDRERRSPGGSFEIDSEQDDEEEIGSHRDPGERPDSG